MENISPLYAISPIDGRYSVQSENLRNYFSEAALFKFRTWVEIQYLLELISSKVLTYQLSGDEINYLEGLYNDFSLNDALEIKNIETTTRHDIKAVEYFIKNKLQRINREDLSEFVHFALTSQDINNTAIPLSLKAATYEVILPKLGELHQTLFELGKNWKKIPMLARTHGQAASPSSLGKEILVFWERLGNQLSKLKQYKFSAKFGGATGNFNAHRISFENVDWESWADQFIFKLGLSRQHFTTQIAHYDEIAEYFQIIVRINTIFIDLCRDIWSYISIEYFTQVSISTEVGSSAMPHKVNPIDFENAEGNCGISNAICQHFVEKLPISRWQRDLTDSTVLRNIGLPIAHLMISVDSILRGFSKLKVNYTKIEADLGNNVLILAEAIQTVLRKEGVSQPYELLKAFTRGKSQLSKVELIQFINGLPVSLEIKEKLLSLSPDKYTGYACDEHFPEL